MQKPHCRPVSLTDALTKQRIRVSGFVPGAALIPVCPPMPILGYWFRQVGALSKCSVYVAGTMPPQLRTAAEEGRTAEEQWLSAVPTGIREIDLTECREDYQVQFPQVA